MVVRIGGVPVATIRSSRPQRCSCRTPAAHQGVRGQRVGPGAMRSMTSTRRPARASSRPSRAGQAGADDDRVVVTSPVMAVAHAIAPSGINGSGPGGAGSRPSGPGRRPAGRVGSHAIQEARVAASHEVEPQHVEAQARESRPPAWIIPRARRARDLEPRVGAAVPGRPEDGLIPARPAGSTLRGFGDPHRARPLLGRAERVAAGARNEPSTWSSSSCSLRRRRRSTPPGPTPAGCGDRRHGATRPTRRTPVATQGIEIRSSGGRRGRPVAANVATGTADDVPTWSPAGSAPPWRRARP